jgi:acetyltransferase-like isoleucine patch superfamily enzyme
MDKLNDIHHSFKHGNGLEIGSFNVIERSVKIGKDCFIGHHNIIRPYVVIGDRVDIRSFVHIAEGAKLGNDIVIFQYSNIAKGTIIENKVFVGAKVLMINTRKISKWRPYPFIYNAPYIEYGVRIGSGALLCPGVRLARNCMIQAGSLVTKDTEAYGIYRGRPAIKIGEILEEERI